MVSPPSNPELRRALERFVSSGSVTSEVREEVAASWARAVSFGLRPDRLDSPWDPDLDSGGRPAKAARPVLDKIGGDLVGTGMSLLLTDERGHVLQRRVTDRGLRAQLDRILLVPGFSYGEEHTGTNAIGTTLDRRRPTVVEGGEHFAEALTIMACAAAPIRDPGAGEVVGIVDLTCSAEDASRLMLPLANQVPRQIEEHLSRGAHRSGCCTSTSSGPAAGSRARWSRSTSRR